MKMYIAKYFVTVEIESDSKNAALEKADEISFFRNEGSYGKNTVLTDTTKTELISFKRK